MVWTAAVSSVLPPPRSLSTYSSRWLNGGWEHTRWRSTRLSASTTRISSSTSIRSGVSSTTRARAPERSVASPTGEISSTPSSHCLRSGGWTRSGKTAEGGWSSSTAAVACPRPSRAPIATSASTPATALTPRIDSNHFIARPSHRRVLDDRPGPALELERQQREAGRVAAGRRRPVQHPPRRHRDRLAALGHPRVEEFERQRPHDLLRRVLLLVAGQHLGLAAPHAAGRQEDRVL